jgi:predicted transcriptional regulator/DNA-binding XRE family transcriptional regulator
VAQKAWLGNKVRRLRRKQGLAQVAMAARLSISPSYLNLIEHNQRPLTLPLLLKLAQEFDIDLRSFSDNEEARLLAELTELQGDPLFTDYELTREDLKQLVAASPNACHAVLALFRSYRSAREDARALLESISDDTFLATSTHELRELLTTIRSYSEILNDYADLEEDHRQQIHAILVRESEKVTHYIDRMLHLPADGALKRLDSPASPDQEAADFLHDRLNHFPTIEDAAETLWRDLALTTENLAARLAERLAEAHRVEVEVVKESDPARTVGRPGDGRPGGGLAGGRLWRFDEKRRRLRLSVALPETSRRFLMARVLGSLACTDRFGEVIAAARLTAPESRSLATGQLARYFAGALLMPYAVFLEAARAGRYDLDLLSRRFQVSFEQVCHRLTTLQRPGAEGIPFHFLRVDIAGNISKRYGGSGFQIPRHGGVCPRWAAHAAFLTPGRIVTQVDSLTDGTGFFEIARAIEKPAGGHGRPHSHVSIGLGCSLSRARELVYSDGLDLDSAQAAVPVGVSCRMCDRTDCAQRAFAPVLQSLAHKREAPEALETVGDE